MVFIICVLITLVLSLGEGCKNGKQLLKSGGLSQLDKQTIVDVHNRLRQYVALGMVSSQPPASNMMEMQWDDELAAVAQQWAEQCITGHDKRQQRDVNRFEVGQNVAATWINIPPSDIKDTKPNFSTQIRAWFDEVDYYGYDPIGVSRGTGHYTQLVWAETSLVGCGYTFFLQPETQRYTKLYVCNYGPTGNIRGTYPYKKGPPSCDNNGLAESRKYSGLCSVVYSSSYNSVYESKKDSLEINIIPESESQQTIYQKDYEYKQQSGDYQYQKTFSNEERQQATTPKAATRKPILFSFGGFQNKKNSVFQINEFKPFTASKTDLQQSPDEKYQDWNSRGGNQETTTPKAFTNKPFIFSFSATLNGKKSKISTYKAVSQDEYARNIVEDNKEMRLQMKDSTTPKTFTNKPIVFSFGGLLNKKTSEYQNNYSKQIITLNNAASKTSIINQDRYQPIASNSNSLTIKTYVNKDSNISSHNLKSVNITSDSELIKQNAINKHTEAINIVKNTTSLHKSGAIKKQSDSRSIFKSNVNSRSSVSFGTIYSQNKDRTSFQPSFSQNFNKPFSRKDHASISFSVNQSSGLSSSRKIDSSFNTKSKRRSGFHFGTLFT